MVAAVNENPSKSKDTSPAGKKLYGTMLPALHGALIKAGGEFGHALMRELGKERA